jgi:hypothetical protein
MYNPHAVRTVVWEGWSREAPPYPDLWPSTSVRCAAAIFPESEVDRTRRGHRENGAYGRVVMWRGGFRLNISVCRPFRLTVL